MAAFGRVSLGRSQPNLRHLDRLLTSKNIWKNTTGRTFVITLSDKGERALTDRAERLNKTPEEVLEQVLSEQLANPDETEPLWEAKLLVVGEGGAGKTPLAEKIKPESDSVQQMESDPLLQLIGSLSVDIPDLAENHDYYIGQALYRELTDAE